MNERKDGARMPGRWAIVLSGGEGERLRPFVREAFGDDRPKQYCSLAGGQTLLEETLSRAGALVDEARLVTVIGRGHSDHYIAPPERFTEAVERAAELCERWTEDLVLLGSAPDGPEQDYGWIEPVRAWTTGGGAMRVARFVEKPGAPEAADLFGRNCLWNTMIMAAKARTLWEMGRRCLPDLMTRFDSILDAVGSPRERSALVAAYRGMGSFNFSKDVLQKLPGRVLVQPMAPVEWSDLGRPERILRAMARRSSSEGRGRPARALALAGER
ncbi:MAG TPA: sugar phosphate nucleotidyltransferase [Elusimicrobiota bacterium]|nr:sugar phosphate nucleotidyltransferase [Elusimicrobiota bacterium]